MKTKRKHMLPALCGIAVCAFQSGMAMAQENAAEFDTSVLENNGLDSSLGTYFAHSAKFLPGRKPVSLKINGNEKGTVTALFGKEGQLCVDRSFLQSAGLQVPAKLAKSPSEQSAKSIDPACYDFRQDYPTAVITPVPGEERLELVVPEAALATGETALSDYQQGGTAGIFNYDLFTTRNQYGGGNDDYGQASLEEGINISDWLLRSRQIFTKDQGDFSSNSLYTYVQHTYVDQKTLMQAGQINITNTLFSGAAISGVQFVPEDALSTEGKSGVTVNGLAQGAQARVEVRQSGALIYSTLVPMGPFTLENVPVARVNADLEVTVKETDGTSHRYIVPAESLHPNQLGGPQGFSIAAGKVRDIDIDNGREKPYLLTASDGWRLTSWLNASAGAMVATKYQAIATGLDIAPMAPLMISTVLKASDDKHDDDRGTSATLSANYRAEYNINLFASASRYSSDYRELLDTLQDDFTPYSGQYTTSVGWSNSLLGSFNMGYTLNQGVNGDDDSRYVSLSWGKTYRDFNVSVSWQKQVNQNDNDSRYSNGDQVYVNVGIPIGSHRVNSYWRKQGESETAGLQTGDNLTPELSYSIAAERDVKDQENSFDGSIADNLHYTQLGLSAGMNGSDSKNYSATLSGGIVAHSDGVTFSPYRIDDSFAVAALSEKVSNVQISTPSGDVWTDHWGRAVIPSLPAYHNAHIEVNSASLPKNIDLNNGISTVAVGHGAVSHVNFGVLDVRRMMLTISLPDGSPLAKGSTIVDADNNYVVTSVDNGLVFLSDADNQSALYATDDNGKRKCQLQYTMPKERDVNVFYESAAGVCK